MILKTCTLKLIFFLIIYLSLSHSFDCIRLNEENICSINAEVDVIECKFAKNFRKSPFINLFFFALAAHHFLPFFFFFAANDFVTFSVNIVGEH